jgi:hypothetical protein
MNKWQELCQQYLAQLKTQEITYVSAKQRLELYYSFGSSRLGVDTIKSRQSPRDFKKYCAAIQQELAGRTQADFAMGWLAVLTAQKVLPIWHEEELSKDWSIFTPDLMIQTAIELLGTNIDLQYTLELFSDFNTAGAGLTNASDLSAFSFYAAYHAVELILYGPNALEQETNQVQPHLEAKSLVPSDFASWAEKAYSFQSAYPSGIRSIRYYELHSEKRLEFWQWWLEEAVPEAWRLAKIVRN